MRPTHDTRELLKAAQTGLDAIYQTGFRYAKPGVMLANFMDESHWQYDIFDDHKRNDKLMNVLESLNQKHHHVLFFASQGINPVWKLKSEFKIP